jgi:hypothetical protein
MFEIVYKYVPSYVLVSSPWFMSLMESIFVIWWTLVYVYKAFHYCLVISEGGTQIVLVCMVDSLLMQHLVPGTLTLSPLWSMCIRRMSVAVTSAFDVTRSLARHTWAPFTGGQTSSFCRVGGWQKRRAHELTPSSQRTRGYTVKRVMAPEETHGVNVVNSAPG